LRGFVAQLGVTGTPGLDLPGLDAVQLAAGYGLPAAHVAWGADLVAELAKVSATSGPRLIEVPITAETRGLG
jgi:benzoylformate decarboxylase